MRGSQGSRLQELKDRIFSQRATKGYQLTSSGRRDILKPSPAKVHLAWLDGVSWEVRANRKSRMVVAQEPEQASPSWNQVSRMDYQGLSTLTLKSRSYTPSYPRTEAFFSIMLDIQQVLYR